jgi:hypothetical protein
MSMLFKARESFSSLSLKDLLEARDVFHYHLMSKKNVVATAIGYYRIRKRDRWPDPKHPDPQAIHPRGKHSARRTLFNSEIRPYSWPCVYVFVSDWMEEQRLAAGDPSDVVPPALYLPDGRVVPVCVIEAKRQPYATDLLIDPNRLMARNVLAPGTPLINDDAQGMERIATAGCVVKDGERYYVLTARHALGATGTTIKAFRRHETVEIGATASEGITRMAFDKAYPHLPSCSQYVMMDVGLVTLEDVTQWTTRFPTIGPVETVLDLYDNAFTLRLIGQRVVGVSAITGMVRGEIHGLFYRYKAAGGYEYLSDFLIGPVTTGPIAEATNESPDENVALDVRHGDSGTLLFIEHDDEVNGKTVRQHHPFALLWGKHEFVDGDELRAQPFALATSLAVALEKLDCDLVREIDLDDDFVWGWVGHYAIGNLLPYALDLLKSAKLKAFVDKNLSRLTMTPDAALDNDPRVILKDAPDHYDPSHPQFVPLADVPDNVWKGNVNRYTVPGADGKKRYETGPGSRGSNDNPNHFADIDLPYKGFKTFLDYTLADLDDRLKPSVWIDYFASLKPTYDAWAKKLGKTGDGSNHWGALPFRVWQLFDAMVASAKKGDQDGFLCAGGVLIHYVGDACQPLHTSYLSNGDPDDVVPKSTSGYKLRADGVHVGYEDDMVSYGYQKQSLANALKAEVASQQKLAKEKLDAIKTGRDAAKAIIRLVKRTRDTITPRDIVDKWIDVKPLKNADRPVAMWNEFGDRTVGCMARGSRVLAAIWQGAWTAGNGEKQIGAGSVRTTKTIEKLYDDPKVLPSVALDKYDAILS